MSCAAGIMKFRLLDAYVGWDPDSVEKITGVEDPAGLTLARLDPDAADLRAVDPYLLPPLLARGCGPCEWFLAAAVRPGDDVPWHLMTLTPCAACWEELRPGGLERLWFDRIVAIAAAPFVVAVADASGKTQVISLADGRVLADVPMAGPIALSPRGDLFVACVKDGKTSVLRFDPSGAFTGFIVRDVAGTAQRIGIAKDCTVWLLVGEPGQAPRLIHITGSGPVTTTAEELAAAFDRTGLRVVAPDGFCVEWGAATNGPASLCGSWLGQCVPSITPVTPPTYEKQGQLLTVAIDSGVPGCRWHRVQVEAVVPAGTAISVSISTSEDANPTVQGSAAAEPGWGAFQAGAPHHNDWQTPNPSGAPDFLVYRQPSGRFVFVRIRMTGDGNSTPIIRRLQLDFERVTSLEFLPAVYRENVEAEDFTERFLSVFDSLLERLDSSIQYAPALLDSDHVPEGALPWIASFYDLVFEREWTVDQQRRILKALPALFRRRGTPAALREAIELVLGAEPAIDELPFERAWSGLGSGLPVGQVRLFGRARARVRLGGSPLGSAPLRHLGNSADDPLQSHAYRFRVRVPSVGRYGAIRADAVRKVVESQKPAHTLVAGDIVAASAGFVLGGQVAVGVDTMFTTLPKPRLGQNIRLSRQSILWHSRRVPPALFALA